jgi:uncharacterized protein (DUF302 family)
VRADLESALRARGFVVLAVKDVSSRAPAAASGAPKGSFVYEVRDPHQRPEDFSADPAKAAEVPHRIAVFERGDGSTRISTLRPTLLADLVGEPGLSPVAALVERGLTEVVRAAAEPSA